MKRTRASLVLTLLSTIATGVSSQDPPPLDIEVRAVRGIGPAATGRLCVGSRNSIRAELEVTGPSGRREIPLRLVLVLPGGDPAGALLAQGRIVFPPGVTSTSWTFVNVEVPERLRDRGGVLEVRANVDGGLRERNLGNNVGAVDLDRVTDWECRR